MKIKVGIFFGGNSVEHEISVISALQAMRAMDTERYDIVPVYITHDDRFFTGEALKTIENFSDVDALLAKSTQVIPVKTDGRIDLYRFPFGMLNRKPVDYIDVAFPIVHGTNVEDGALQGYLKYMGVPMVGPDVMASAVGMDKYVMKNLLRAEGIPVLDGMTITSYDFEIDEDAVIRGVEEHFAYPVIVKPVNLGSSVGIRIAHDQQGLREAAAYAFEYAHCALVERAITQLREINCSVLGDMEEAIASECEEPFNTDEILSYEDKYMGSSSSKGMASVKRKLPADISDSMREQIRGLAVRTFRAMRCCGVVRIDFMIDEADGDRVYVNEVNTIPGSLAFYLWKESGIEYRELLSRLIDLAFKRAREESAISYEIETNILKGYSFGGAKGSKAKGEKI